MADTPLQQPGEIEDIFADSNTGANQASAAASYPTQPSAPAMPQPTPPATPPATPPVTPATPATQPAVEDLFEPETPVEPQTPVEPLASEIPYGNPPSDQAPMPFGGQDTPATLPSLLESTPAPGEQPTGNKMPPEDKKRPSKRRVGRGSRLRLIVLVISILVLVIVLIWGYGPRLWGGGNGSQLNTVDSELQNINQVTPVNDSTIQNGNGTNQDATNTTDQTTAIIDSDGDGLLDSEEAVLKTNPEKIDTDSDGLSDRQEVRVYKTNPRKADTDGDGFDDAEEVRNFFDPNGPGKLPSIVDAIDEFNAQQNTNSQAQ